ncbi:MAG: methyltransferase domain-containing protein [Cyclobacteriaceae bacterium]
MKELVKKILQNFGLQIRRLEKNDFDNECYKVFYPEESIISKNFYNVGAGGFSHPYWTNIDYFSDWYEGNSELTEKGIPFDLYSMEPIPVPDGVAELIYSSHTIEHIKDQHAQNFFNESWRLLKKDGLIRIVCPDIDLHYAALKNNDPSFFYSWRGAYPTEAEYKKVMLNKPLNEASIEQLFLESFASASSTLHLDGAQQRISDEELRNLFKEIPYEEALDFCCNKCPIEIQRKYPGNHTNWWNREKVTEMMKSAGFNNIYISGYGQSRSPVLRDTKLFDTLPEISLFVEARK